MPVSQKGTPDLKSAGAIAFGPDGVLFVGDTGGSRRLFAVDPSDRGPAAKGTVKLEAVNRKIADALGTTPEGILVSDMAVNPISGRGSIFRSTRPRGPTRPR